MTNPFQSLGKVTFCDASWAARSQSAYANEILYCGYRYDPETGMYHVRLRPYHPGIGSWIGNDPFVYTDGLNLYGYCLSHPAAYVDWLGGSGQASQPAVAPRDLPPQPEAITKKIGELRKNKDQILYGEKKNKEKPDGIVGALRKLCDNKECACPECKQSDCYAEAEKIATAYFDAVVDNLYSDKSHQAESYRVGLVDKPWDDVGEIKGGWLCYQWSEIVFRKISALGLKCFKWDRVAQGGVTQNPPATWPPKEAEIVPLAAKTNWVQISRPRKDDHSKPVHVLLAKDCAVHLDPYFTLSPKVYGAGEDKIHAPGWLTTGVSFSAQSVQDTQDQLKKLPATDVRRLADIKIYDVSGEGVVLQAVDNPKLVGTIQKANKPYPGWVGIGQSDVLGKK